MTELLERAFAEASRLSSEEQDSLADWLLRELKSETCWASLLGSSQDALAKLAGEALAEHKAGETQPLNVEEL